MLKKYAKLLVDYSLELTSGEWLFIQSTMLAEPLVREVYDYATSKGVHVDIQLDLREQNRLFYKSAQTHQLEWVSPIKKKLFESCDAYLNIRAPFNLMENASIDPEKQKIRQKAVKELNDLYFERTGNGSMRRTLCQYPTQAAAQLAGMSLDEYEHFVFNACRLYDEDPMASWLQVRKHQQKLTDYLNNCTTVQYIGPNIDMTFSTKGRKWINSDGQANMPSGEVYTAPVDDSANGWVNFTYLSVYKGHEVENVRLEVKDGYIESWSADRGIEFLNKVFEIPGTRRFGEAAIGMNYDIQRITKNILFDEKIGGSIHMAIGQAYKQCNGVNESSVHWDMITDMKHGGKIIADGTVIYRDGKLTI